MIRLALRLALFGGRDQFARQAVTVAATAFGVALLLVTASFGPALDQRTRREAQRGSFAPRVEWERGRLGSLGADTLLIAHSTTIVGERELNVVSLGAAGPSAPVLPGLTRLPSPGEVFVSPALGDLLDGGGVRERLADLGRVERGAAVGPPALIYPDEVVAFAGKDPAALAEVVSAEVEQFPLEAPAFVLQSKTPVRLGMIMGLVGLFVPLALLVGVAARLGAAQREQRLAAMRLAGASPAQVRRIIGVEAALTGAAGSVLGLVAFFGVRAMAAKVAIGGMEWFPTDFSPGLLPAFAILAGVPLVSALGAILSLRRVHVSPLQVASRGQRQPLNRVRFASAAIGIAGLIASAVTGPAIAPSTLLIVGGASVLFVALGLPVLGPWVTERVGGFVARRTERVATMIAARRLQAEPASAFRPSTGVAVALFFAAAFYAYAEGNLGAPPTAQLPGNASMRVETRGVAPAAVDAIEQRIKSVDGAKVVSIKRARAGGIPVAVASCRHLVDLRLVAPTRCEAPVLVTPGTPARFSRQEEVTLVARGGDAEAVVSLTDTQPVRAVGEDVLGGPVVEPKSLPGSFVRQLPSDQLLITGGTGARSAVTATLLATLPGGTIETYESVVAKYRRPIEEVERGINLLVALILVVAIAGLGAAITTGILERRQTFTLLRASGVGIRHVYGAAAIEAAIPFGLAVTSGVALGLAAATSFTTAVDATMSVPWAKLGVLVPSVAVTATLLLAGTFPMIARATSIRALRQE